jgi:hypothetical protein
MAFYQGCIFYQELNKMKKYLSIGKDTNGERNMLARFLFNGDKYGKDDCLRHADEDPIIEFYGRTDDKKSEPHFIGRYYLSTMNDNVKRNDGLCLCGQTGLSLSAEAIKEAVDACIDAWEERQADDAFKILEYKAMDLIQDFGTDPQRLSAMARALATVAAYEVNAKAAIVALPVMFHGMTEAWVDAMSDREEDGMLE